MKELKYRISQKNTGNLQNVFIHTEKNWESTENKNLSVMESGEKKILFNKIIDSINVAQRMICLQSFLIQDTTIIDALIKAKKEREVKIFIMDSAEARLNNSGFEEDENFATKDYKKMLVNKFKNNFVHRQAENLHAKFILIDPKTNPQGYLFTGNFNEKPFFENPELAVKLSKTQVKELFMVFTYHFWEYTTDEQTVREQFDKVKPSGKFKNPQLKTILVTSPNEKLSNLKNNLLTSVIKSEKEIAFSTFGFDINNELSQEILKKLQNGIKVKVFCRPREKAIKGNIEILAKNGAEIFCHPLIHAKSMIIDNEEAFIFSANFENHGLDNGFEVGSKLNKEQLFDLVKIYKSWQNNFPYQLKSSIPISEIHKYYTFNSVGRIEQKEIKKEEIKSINKTIVRVEEFINFHKDIKIPESFSAQKFTHENILKFNELKENYKIVESIVSGVDIVEYKKLVQRKTNKKPEKTKTEQVVLLTTSNIIDVEKIIDILDDDYVGFNIFAKNE